MRVAIMGAGPGGGYLAALLARSRPDVETAVFTRSHRTHCGIRGCAWGVPWRPFAALLAEIGMDAAEYVIARSDTVRVEGLLVPADVAMIDKPRLLESLAGGRRLGDPGEAALGEFDRVVDATGAERAYLSASEDAFVVHAAQVRLRVSRESPPAVRLNRLGGYDWRFPLGEMGEHAGASSYRGIDVARDEVRRMVSEGAERVCACEARLRVHGPLFPVVEERVWGLGEAIGAVDPISGAGIVPAMRTARMMVEHWMDAGAYEAAVEDAFGHLARNARVMDALSRGRRPERGDVTVSREYLASLGLHPGRALALRIGMRAWRYVRRVRNAYR